MTTSRRMTFRSAGIACSAVLGFALVPDMALSQGEPSSSASQARNGVPLQQLIEGVAKRTNKTFLLDPRVNGNVVMIGIDPAKITYSQLLAALQIHGYAAVEMGGITRVVPDANARAMATPVISGNDKRDDAEYVTRILKVNSVSAPQLVPIIRSLLPQNAHLAAYQCTNELLIVDTYANVKRIESIVAGLDKGPPFVPEKCANRPPEVVVPTPPPSPATRPAPER
jgi:type II secretory pathway component GspD/PulD (secretin)